MKKLHLSIAAALVVTAALVSTTSLTASAAPNPSISDHDLVAGLVYGAGDAGRDLGLSPVDLPSGISKQMAEESAQETTTELLASRGKQMRPILVELKSGNPVRVQAAFEPLGSVLKDFSVEQMRAHGLAPEDVRPEESSRCGFAVVCVAYAAAAVHNVAVVTAAAAAVVSVALWCGAWTWCGKSAETSESRAAQERLALSISNL